jgi:hypothetical protein
MMRSRQENVTRKKEKEKEENVSELWYQVYKQYMTVLYDNGLSLAVFILGRFYGTFIETCSSDVSKEMAARNFAICRLKA